MTINNVSNPEPRSGASKGQPLDLAESVAGDDDSQAPMSPSGEVLLGTPESGREACPRCGGSGTLAGRDCPECQGSGKVNVGIGGV